MHLLPVLMLEVLSVDQALTVAHEPDLTSATGINDGRGGEPFLRMLLQTGDDVDLMRSPDGDIDLADGSCHADAELVTGVGGRHVSDEGGDGTHGTKAVAHHRSPFTVGLRGGAVDDGNEVTCDDDSVLAFPGGALRSEALLYDLHS